MILRFSAKHVPAPASSGWNRQVLWGWKRDSGEFQRVILFHATLRPEQQGAVALDDWCFFYRHRASSRDVHSIHRRLSTPLVSNTIGTARLANGERGLATVTLAGGPGLPRLRPIVGRLMNRRPRRTLPEANCPTPTEDQIELKDLGRLVAYVGSGLSYESRLPTLASVHETFGVDTLGASDFLFGRKDPIPEQLEKSVSETFRRFVKLHIAAARVRPSASHQWLAELFRIGVVRKILTDNVDNLFASLSTPFTRTRGLGIFNDRFETSFKGVDTLLVIGVAADRREIIRQARRSGVRIVVVNPQNDVSPRSQNLTYLRPGDTWYRMTAREFFESYAS